MTLNWFTVIAQILNFLILVWLLKRYLYKPILSAIEARENIIKARIEESENIKNDAIHERTEYVQKNQLFEKEKEEMMEKAVKEVDQQRAELLEKARDEVKEMRENFKKSLQDEYEQLSKEISNKISTEVLSIIRTTLATLANEDLEQKIVAVFIGMLQKKEQKIWESIEQSLQKDHQSLKVLSAFEISEEQKKQIEQEVVNNLGEDKRIHFAKSPEMISGIEISANGYKISWSVTDYVASIEKSIQDTIAKATKE